VLRTNLSTRPFYNERAVHVAAAGVALVVLLITAWQITRIVRLSHEKTELQTAIQRDRAEMEMRARDAAQIRRGLDQKELKLVSGAAKEANDLIDQRTFSWTQLFNQLESTLPDDVMLTSIHPEFKDNVTTINVDLQGKRSEDIDTFWDRLEKTGSFRDIQWSNVTVTEEGLRRIQMKAVYSSPAPAPRPASTTGAGR
jgi:Tfp pilus assembly protein PilN